jgi:hypothetical protein
MAWRPGRRERPDVVGSARAGRGARVLGPPALLALLVLAGAAASGAPAVVRPAVRVVPAAVQTGATERAAVPSPTPSAVPTFRSVRTYAAVAIPVRLRIPAIGVTTRLQHVGLAADGTIAAPTLWEAAGWYARGPRPGQPAPAVIVGHVDSRSGPAVFHRLAELRAGAEVFVDRADGTTVRFRVTDHRQVAKSAFPADLVYAPTLETLLRLVTCGGTFDARSGHYRDNIVVSAAAG